ncbi:PilZ domain-containing protein [Aquibacillus sp. 3ASR75-11]|uniref:PilZ domain-containing protein n=1 Tax=Terrihalobacillus insolitus TaxID=2950438 RepID=A0A9X3WS10_9BACI|nr:PilZ domain-containing protein [Terrihalobacillus insolitus]MDC3412745.1 PilZ domain-containing protein [Terrihalobacillus insolitus]MDC3423778.1 PilZ domain-containing protein [Terrihalobacillus insolitus]
MYYKRNEPYRYSFPEPVQGTLEDITEERDAVFDVYLLDLSLSGAKITCPLDSPIEKWTTYMLRFSLKDEDFHTAVNLVWIRQAGKISIGGLKLDSDNEFRQRITSILKQLAKANT